MQIFHQIFQVLKEFRKFDAKLVKFPQNCPACGSKLIQEENEAITKCVNSRCPAKLKGLLRHWVSKGSMNIEGLGEKIIHQLVNEGYVKSIADLYKLEIDSLLGLDRFGEKSANNLLVEINESKNKN